MSLRQQKVQVKFLTTLAMLIAIPLMLSQIGCSVSVKSVDSDVDAKPADAAQDSMAAFQAVESEYKSETDKMRAAYRAAKTDKEEQAALAKAPDLEEYQQRFSEIVESHSGTKASQKALLWIASHARTFSTETIEAMNREMIDSEDTVQLLGRLTRNPNDELESVFDNAMEHSTIERNRGFATLLKAKRLIYRRKIESRKDEIESLLQKVVTEFAEIDNSRNGTLKDSAEAMLFQLNHLQVGMEAPDIEGEDIHGEEFRLSDYRGKVVFLDFWGDW